MQVILMLLLLFSDSFAFGLRPMLGYSVWVAVAWTVLTVAIMALPYFRNEAIENNQAA